ncbi:hypothetical protein HOD61_02600 [archaeon]|jgi:hypothetical protein|nr:hypothetical protein [archaeon]
MEEHKRKKKINTWKVSSFTLGFLLVISILTGSFGMNIVGTTGNVVAENAVDYINTNLLQGQATAELGIVTNEEGLIKAEISVMGQNMDVYMTENGNLLFLQAINMAEEIETPVAQDQPTTQDIPKSDKPVIEAFIMSHCPYGTQIEKGLLPVANALGDKIDFKFKFVYYAMHGETEVVEQLNQHCIQEEQNDKFLTYLECFLEAGDSEGCLASTEINLESLNECTTRVDEEFNVMANLEDESSWLSGKFPLFDIHKAENDLYSVGGSPTLVINGQVAQSGRDSVSLLNTICNAFNIAPEECNTEFEAVAPGPGFGWDSTGASNNAAACGS